MADIRKIFYPESIAVVGATENLFKWGSYIFTNIIAGGFQGKVYPVAKKKETVYGHRAYGSVAEIQDPVDLVFITTPAASVMGVLADCVAKGVKNVVMITSGFSETGEEGKRLEEEMVSFARANGINVVGPNTMGIVNTAVGLYATGSQVRAPRGGISIIAQSGNVGNQIMEWAEQQNIGVGKFVGSGNEGVIGCEDYIGYFGDDADTTVVLMYIEGVDDGRRFMDSARGASMRKPVIALKAGRTEIGSRAAASHTGAMAGSFKTYESALRQSGVILVKAPTELLTISSAFDSMPLPKGNRVGVVTLGGG
ncbi:MAG: CoA-binding protein, partial [Spirochaetes bacterium]|nr:CoA-binding protein [Spirochaetota bacterium]